MLVTKCIIHGTCKAKNRPSQESVGLRVIALFSIHEVYNNSECIVVLVHAVLASNIQMHLRGITFFLV